MADRGFLIDASVLIGFLRNEPAADNYLSPLIARRLALIHPIAEAEVVGGARNQREFRVLRKAIGILPRAALKSADFQVCLDLMERHSLADGSGFADCLLAATALRLALPLVTLNDKHFRPIKGLKVLRPY